jgi:hypothetical protein
MPDREHTERLRQRHGGQQARAGEVGADHHRLAPQPVGRRAGEQAEEQVRQRFQPDHRGGQGR